MRPPIDLIDKLAPDHRLEPVPVTACAVQGIAQVVGRAMLVVLPEEGDRVRQFGRRLFKARRSAAPAGSRTTMVGPSDRMSLTLTTLRRMMTRSTSRGKIASPKIAVGKANFFAARRASSPASAG